MTHDEVHKDARLLLENLIHYPGMLKPPKYLEDDLRAVETMLLRYFRWGQQEPKTEAW